MSSRNERNGVYTVAVPIGGVSAQPFAGPSISYRTR